MIWQSSEQINEIAGALAAAQAQLENVGKDGKNPHFKSKYATLGAVLDEVRPKFTSHGIAIVQMAVNGDASNIGVITRLIHKSGQWIESGLYVAPTKFDAQGAGSVISYLRRYALMAMAGVGQDDDDGEAAIRQPHERPPATRQTGSADNDPFVAVNSRNTQAPGLSDAEREFIATMRRRVAEQRLPANIDKIITVNAGPLARLKEVNPRAYDDLMVYVNAAKQELFAGAA